MQVALQWRRVKREMYTGNPQILCKIDSYDPEIGCNRNCNGYKKKEDEVKVFDALKARKVLERVNKFLGILIRENLVKDAPLLEDGEIENESDLADDVWEVLQGFPRNCDVGTSEEQAERFMKFCYRQKCNECKLYTDETFYECVLRWSQMPYEEGGAE